MDLLSLLFFHQAPNIEEKRDLELENIVGNLDPIIIMYFMVTPRPEPCSVAIFTGTSSKSL